jgi:hypothetical protein
MKRVDTTRISGMYRCLQHSATTELAGYLNGNHQALVDYKLDISAYSDAWTFRDDYLAVELMSKYPYLAIDVNREAVALQKFADAELQCSETNKRLSSEVLSLTTIYTPGSIISMARLKIAALLGPFSWDKAEQHFGFGPGSTTSLARRFGDAYYKFGHNRPHTTKACSVLALTSIRRIPTWYSRLLHNVGETPESILSKSLEEQINLLFEVVPGNRVTTVPKNAKTDRVIAIEPDLNMFIQKGIGALIRSRLKKVGIDLDTQLPNQELASVGSLTGEYATIDLSSASDTVSMKLCELLLPSDWFEAIKLSRSPRGVLPDGTLITYHKVSSMGNGFTFELESLLFWALCKSVMSLFRTDKGRLVVYGDDIIIPVAAYHTVVWMLNYCGFTVNSRKSFSTGPFRESCGKHFFNGVDVTPFYIREDIKDPSRLFWFANSVRRWARHPIYGLDGRLEKVYNRSVSLLPRRLQKPSIPDGLGDLALIGDFDEVRPSWSKHLQCWVAIGYGDVPRSKNGDGVPYLLRSLSKLDRQLSHSDLISSLLLGKSLGMNDFDLSWKVTEGSSGIPIAGYRSNWKLVRVPITRWESYGPWLGL